MTRRESKLLPISERPLPDGMMWTDEDAFLREAGAQSVKTETTYRSGLRLFADWLQHYRKAGYSRKDEWPLTPDRLTTDVLLEYRGWLLSNRAKSTVTTYMAAIVGYLNFLDGYDRLPDTIQLGKLQRQMARRQIERNQAENVIDLDLARQDVPRIVAFYDTLPLPPENDRYNHRLTLLRDRAIVRMLYSTAARISEVVSLNRANVGHGRAAYATIVGKGNKGRTLHIRAYAREAVVAYLAERGDTNQALFVSHSRNSSNARLSITSVHNVVKRAVNSLNLHESLSAHDFRHYRATQLLRAGMPLEVVQEFLGHADVTTTRNIYAPVLGVQVVTEWLDNLDVAPRDALQDSNNDTVTDERVQAILDTL